MEEGPKLTITTFSHNWGFILPYKSGIVWQQQTKGILCSQVFIEGAFIPINDPVEITGVKRMTKVNLLDKLANANYNGLDTRSIWNKIKETMHFDFEIVDAPNGQPHSQEGLLWIKLTKFEPGWGHGEWVLNLIGKTLALIYPNCD